MRKVGWRGEYLCLREDAKTSAVIVAMSDVGDEAGTSLIEEVCRWVAARSIGGVGR